MAIPTLLLSPDGSRDRNGPVTPTVVGDVQIVNGNWEGSRGDYVRMDIDSSIATAGSSTLLIRARYTNREISAMYPVGFNTVSWSVYSTSSSTGVRIGNPPAISSTSTAIPDNEWVVIAMTDNAGVAKVFIDGVIGHESTYTGTNELVYIHTAREGGSGGFDWEVEGVLVYPEALTEEEIYRISTMPEAWTWENLKPRIGGVRTVHDPAPFAVRSIHEEI